jgi:hypothetical protein
VRAAGAGGVADVRLRLKHGGRDGPLRPSRRDLAVFGGYLLAAAVYIAIGLYTVDFLLSYWVAVAYVVVAAWVVPAAVRRLR